MLYLLINTNTREVKDFEEMPATFLPTGEYLFRIEKKDGPIPYSLARLIGDDWAGTSRQSTLEQARLRCMLDAFVDHLQRTSSTTQWLKSLYNDTAKSFGLEILNV